MADHTPTPWHTSATKHYVRKHDGDWPAWNICEMNVNSNAFMGDAKRVVACVNAFHSNDGRELPTEAITPGLFWEMRDLLALVPPEYFPADEARALLSKLEPQR